MGNVNILGDEARLKNGVCTTMYISEANTLNSSSVSSPFLYLSRFRLLSANDFVAVQQA